MCPKLWPSETWDSIILAALRSWGTEGEKEEKEKEQDEEEEEQQQQEQELEGRRMVCKSFCALVAEKWDHVTDRQQTQENQQSVHNSRSFGRMF